MENTVRVLLAEPEREILSLLTLSLSEIKECSLEICSETSEVLKRTSEAKPGLVLFNAGNDPEHCLRILHEIHQDNPGVYVIVSLLERFQSATDSLMAAGAHDCVLKDRNYVVNIVSAVKKALIRIAERDAFDIPVLARAQRFAMDENLPDVIFSVDLDGKILYANQAISSVLGYEQKEIVGTDFITLIAGESDQNAFRQYLERVEENTNFREMVLLKDFAGQHTSFDINFTLMEGEIVYGVVRKQLPPSDETELGTDSGGAGEAAVPSPDSIPAHLGPYRIVTLLGAGSMGRVYKGFDEQLERNVAIKVISKSLAENQNYVDRFKREAKILASISHPNIALIYYFGSLDGLPYFCMEFLANGNVENLLEVHQVIDPQIAISYVIQVASGLREALSKGVLHMDIKPSNLMIAEDGRVKIVDFGLAQTKREMDDLDKNIVGTPLYVAPEQIVGGVADFRMDIYSLGITFFEMLYGFVPFRGSNVPDIFHAKLKGAMPARSELNLAVPPRFYDLVSRMIARDPLQRIASYSELLEELESARRSAVLVEPAPEIVRPDTSAVTMRGSIYDNPFPEVLGRIAQQKLSGKLMISWGSIFKQLHFKNGKLIAILSNQEGENFIDLVISHLPADAKVMRRLQANQSSDLYQGFSTVLQKLSPDIRIGLSEDLNVHARKIIESLFPWMMGEFIFEEGEFPGQLDLEISLHDIVTLGVRSWLDSDFIRRRLFDGNCYIRRDDNYIRYLRDLNLEPSDRFLLFRFDDEIHYSKLHEVSGISQEEFGRLIFLFLCFGLVHVVRSAEHQSMPAAVPMTESVAGVGAPRQDAQRRGGDPGTYYAHCAIKSFEENNYRACIEYCKKSVEHKPDPGVYRLMGRALAQSRFWHEALESYQKALSLSPNHPGIERDMADIYFDTGKFGIAKNKYEALVHQDPTDHHSSKRLQELNRRRF